MVLVVFVFDLDFTWRGRVSRFRCAGCSGDGVARPAAKESCEDVHLESKILQDVDSVLAIFLRCFLIRVTAQ